MITEELNFHVKMTAIVEKRGVETGLFTIIADSPIGKEEMAEHPDLSEITYLSKPSVVDGQHVYVCEARI